jgi:hypothetical protein
MGGGGGQTRQISFRARLVGRITSGQAAWRSESHDWLHVLSSRCGPHKP